MSQRASETKIWSISILNILHSDSHIQQLTIVSDSALQSSASRFWVQTCLGSCHGCSSCFVALMEIWIIVLSFTKLFDGDLRRRTIFKGLPHSGFFPSLRGILVSQCLHALLVSTLHIGVHNPISYTLKLTQNLMLVMLLLYLTLAVGRVPWTYNWKCQNCSKNFATWGEDFISEYVVWKVTFMGIVG